MMCKSEELLQEIENELRSRKGFGNLFDELDYDVEQELRETLLNIIKKYVKGI